MIKHSLSKISEKVPSEELRKKANYFEDSLLVPVKESDALNQKSKLNRVLREDSRTNNALDAWNVSFKKFVSTKSRMIGADIIRRKHKYSIANEKLVQNAKTTIETT